MAGKKFHMTIPGCKTSGCPSYVNNCNETTFVGRAHGRTLYRGERYCLHGKQARQFPKNASTRASWCPRLLRNPCIRVYTRRPPNYFEDRFGIAVYRAQAKDYFLCRTTSTTLTPLQFCKKLCRRDTDYHDLLSWDPRPYDVIEIDVGLKKFHVWLDTDGWAQVYDFDAEQADCGVFGDFTVLPHQDLELERYSKETATSKLCAGYADGYFAGGVFRCLWVGNPNFDEDGEADQGELDNLLLTLQSSGFLKSLPDVESYCLDHWWARLGYDIAPDERCYAFRCDGKQFTYYLRLVPDEESSYNILIFCYQAPGQR